MREPLDILKEVTDRLETTASDPRWINDAMQELKASLESGAQPPAPDMSAFDDLPDHTDMAAIAALTGLAPVFLTSLDFEVVQGATEAANKAKSDAAKAKIRKLATVSTAIGIQMSVCRKRRKAEGKG